MFWKRFEGVTWKEGEGRRKGAGNLDKVEEKFFFFFSESSFSVYIGLLDTLD